MDNDLRFRIRDLIREGNLLGYKKLIDFLQIRCYEKNGEIFEHFSFLHRSSHREKPALIRYREIVKLLLHYQIEINVFKQTNQLFGYTIVCNKHTITCERYENKYVAALNAFKVGFELLNTVLLSEKNNKKDNGR